MCTQLYNAIHTLAVRKLTQWLYFSLDHFFYSEKLQLGKEGAEGWLNDESNAFTAFHTRLTKVEVRTLCWLTHTQAHPHMPIYTRYFISQPFHCWTDCRWSLQTHVHSLSSWSPHLLRGGLCGLPQEFESGQSALYKVRIRYIEYHSNYNIQLWSYIE